MFFSLISLALLGTSPADADSSHALLRRADRLVREGTVPQAQEALQSAYDAIFHINPSDPMLPMLQARLDRYAMLKTLKTLKTPTLTLLPPPLGSLSLTQDDYAYLSIESAWREGRFWQAKRELNALLLSLCHEPMTPSQNALIAECLYLQAEMECLQRDLPAAYHAYTQARSFSQSAYAPWYADAIFKSGYCLLVGEHGFGPLTVRLAEVERLTLDPALSAQQRACLLEAAEILKARPFSRQKIQEWVQRTVDMIGPFSFPEVYANQSPTFPDGLHLADGLHHALCVALKKSDLEKAVEWRDLLEQRCPKSPQCAEACFCLAQDAEERGDFQKAYLYYREGAERFPESPFAAESAFLSYSYQDYVEGQSHALAHLKALEQRFPHSRYALFSRYVRALHDLYPKQGDQADPLAALEELQELLEHAEGIQESGELQEKERAEVAALMVQALYEKAKACLVVASQANGAKKSLFLALAQESYQKLVHLQGLCALLKGECYMALAEIAECRGEETEACRLLETWLKELKELNASRAFVSPNSLARAYYRLGRLCARLYEHEAALKWLTLAKTWSTSGNLSAEERLDLFF